VSILEQVDNDVTGWPTQHRARLGIGYMPEDRRLIPELTVRSNIELPLEVARLEATERTRRVSSVLDMIPEPDQGWIVPVFDRLLRSLSRSREASPGHWHGRCPCRVSYRRGRTLIARNAWKGARCVEAYFRECLAAAPICA
jgi:hypothetical protein